MRRQTTITGAKWIYLCLLSVRWFDFQEKKNGLQTIVTKVIEVRPDKLPYIVECGGKEMLWSQRMIRPEKVAAADEAQVNEGEFCLILISADFYLIIQMWS